MKKLFFLVACFLLLPTAVFANRPMVDGFDFETAKVADSFFMAGNVVDVNDEIDGDLFLAGKTVKLSGSVYEDLFMAGNNITISGRVLDDAKVAGQNIEVSGRISESFIGAGGFLIIKDNAEIGGDMVFSGEKVIVDGNIKGNAKIFARDVQIRGTINGNAEIIAENVVFDKNGLIKGDLDLQSTDTIDHQYVQGRFVYNKIDNQGFEKMDIKSQVVGIILSVVVIKFISALALAALLIFLFKNWLISFIDEAKVNPWPNLGWGFLAMIAAPLVAITLLMTVIGIPLGFIFGLLYAALLIVVHLVEGFFAGALIFPIDKKTGFWKMLGIFAIGKGILMFLFLIPVLGWLARLLVFLIVLGAICKTKIDLCKFLREKKKI